MDAILEKFTLAQQSENGYILASCLTPALPNHLESIAHTRTSSDSVAADIRYATVYNSLLSMGKDTANVWKDMLNTWHTAIGDIVDAEAVDSKDTSQQGDSAGVLWGRVYEAWKKVADLLIKGYNAGKLPAWTVPCMYVAGKYMRIFAIRADAEEAAARAAGVLNGNGNGEGVGFGAGGFEEVDAEADDGENQKLEDAGRMISRMFSCCVSDRAPLETSRKWALYYVSNLLFKTYFKLNKPHLLTPIIRTLTNSSSSTPDSAPLTSYPKAHQTTYHYHHGVALFLSENYPAAQTALSAALALCPRITSRSAVASRAAGRACAKNRRLILTYLIPCRLLTSQQLPTKRLLSANPGLSALFGPLCACLRRGDLAGYDAALERGMPEFVKRRIYLTLERGRDIALRNVLRRVVVAGGDNDGEKRSRVRIEEFVAGLRVANGGRRGDLLGAVANGGDGDVGGGSANGGRGSIQDEQDEVECLIANAIYKNMLKGYIARTQGMVVLSKGGAFPGTGV